MTADALSDPVRLAALEASRWLERTAVDAEHLVRLGAAVLDAPICLLNLLDGETQHPLAVYGFPRERAVVPARESFCAHTIITGRTVAISDSTLDPRVCGLPAARAGLRAYLGEPVRLDGHSVGAICALDYVPRTWSEEERTHLRTLAASASLLLQAGRMRT